MHELALFAGTGGGLLGTRLLGWRPVCAVEIEPYCREVLLRRQRDGLLPLFPIWDDARTFDGTEWRGRVEVLTAGFPCQPFSPVGKGRGAADEQNMWPDTIRIIREVGPRYCLLENVPALLFHPYAGTIFGELAESGYRLRWDCLSAKTIGAWQLRKRLWIAAYAEGKRSAENEVQHCEHAQGSAEGWFRRYGPPIRAQVAGRTSLRIPADLRMADGAAFRVDRIKALGNGQVPAVVRAAWRLLSPDLHTQEDCP